jgi:DNA-binding IclR family transcriptional regulator
MRRRYLRLLLDMGLVEYTIPGKPNSKHQRYRLTAKGSEIAARQEAGHGVNGGVNRGVNRGVNGVNRGVNAMPVTDSVINTLWSNPKLSARMIASLLGVGTRTVQRALKTLQDAGRIRRIGGTRGKWEVVE